MKEHYFARPRRWRFDFCFPEHMLAIEVEGGGWVEGRHVRGAGFARDLEKYNTAVVMGWRLLRVDGAMIKDGRAIAFIKQALESADGSG